MPTQEKKPTKTSGYFGEHKVNIHTLNSSELKV